jgi:hypothetical protein
MPVGGTAIIAKHGAINLLHDFFPILELITIRED